MTTALIVIVLVGPFVWLSITRPAPGPSVPTDRDGVRQLADLRALAGAPADLSLDDAGRLSPRTRP
ncbi:MAG: hypothetical protein QOF00_1083 [Pseudonocardiales bacterium]|jgi:hypothetical protein|nr:hypothetical protein [Pseudonocardiales bacterium]